MSVSWRPALAIAIFALSTAVVLSFDGPQPPQLSDPSMATGTLTIQRRNVSSNATIYYSFKNAGKLRVDQDLGGGQIHTYIGDWKTSKSFFFFNNPQRCFVISNPHAVPEPTFFNNAKFLGRVLVNGIMTQRWCTNPKEHGCKGNGHSSDVNLWVKDSDPSYPVRLTFFDYQLDILTFKPRWAGDPTVWDIPKSCAV